MGADFEKIFRENKDSLFNFVYRMTGDYHLTEDILQDVFFKVYKGLGQFEGRSSIKTWLFKIAINSTNDEMRRKNRFFKVFRTYDDGMDISSGLDIEKELLIKESRSVLQKELNKLKNDIRAVLLLFYFEGLKIEEISQITGKSKENVKVMLHRGRNTLKKRLKRYGYDV